MCAGPPSPARAVHLAGTRNIAAMKRIRASLGKTTRPSLTGITPRQRVFSLLERGRAGPIVWVSGPPGSGKTTAVASFLDHAQIPCLWYQLDEGDADVATFFHYLRLAGNELGEPSDEPLPILTPEYYAGLPVFTRRYFQALYARLKVPFAVVFDGYHEVPASSQLHEVMRDALRELPSGGCAILVSRGDPPPVFARFRANRALTVIGWDELRLTRDETGSIVAHSKLPSSVLDELYAKTQGWAAGLVLMLEQAKTIGSIADPPDISTRQLVFDYLAGELFQKSDARTQDFLLKTACLAQMTTAIAHGLTGESEAGRILAELHRNNYFVTLRQVRPEPVYTYHPMFREFLLARAQETLSKDRRRELQKAAGLLMEGAGYVEDAVALYRDSHDWNEMARVIEQHAAAMLEQGRGETLLHWVEVLPTEIQHDRPWTLYWAAASRVQLAPREGRLLFEQAFERFRTQEPPEVKGMILACSGAMDAILYELDDFSLLDRWIAVLDDAMKSGLEFGAPEVEARVACSMVFSLTLRQPYRRDIEQWIERAIARSREAADVNLKMFVGLLSALPIMWTGAHARAEGLIESMRGLSESPGVSPFSLLTLKNVEAMLYMLTAEHERCLKAMREGLETAEASGLHTWTFQLLIHGYGGALGGQDLPAATEIARRLESLAPGTGRLNQCLYHYFRAWHAILRRETMPALQHQKAALRMAVEVGSPFFEALCRLALAQILAECGDERKCAAHLQRVHTIVRGIDNKHLEFSCLIGFAQIAMEHGRQRPGLRALHRGFELGRQYGYTHFLWWRPAAVARVCAHALESGIEIDYVRNLIRTRSLVPEEPPLAIEAWPWAFRVHTLGVFRLLRHGEPLAVSGKAQRRPLELLKVLIANGGEQVSEDRVTEAMWPRIEGDSAHRSFTSTLHRLRKLLGEDRAVVLHEGRLTLDRRFFWVDAWVFEHTLAELDAAFRHSRAGLGAARVEEMGERVLALYKGPFMATDADEAWYVPPRERLRNRFARVMTDVAHYWETSGQWERSIDCCEKCLEADPLAESFYRRLMVCYRQLGRRAEAMEVYNRCRKVLDTALKVEPSPETKTLYEDLVKVGQPAVKK